jgi:hypothetical protein
MTGVRQETETNKYHKSLCTNPFTSCPKNLLDNAVMSSFGALNRAKLPWVSKRMFNLQSGPQIFIQAGVLMNTHQ